MYLSLLFVEKLRSQINETWTNYDVHFTFLKHCHFLIRNKIKLNFYHTYLSFIQINVLDEYFDIKLYLKK